MRDEGPEPEEPLAPYYPDRVPSLPSHGRRWVAVLLLLLVFVLVWVFSLVGWLLRFL